MTAIDQAAPAVADAWPMHLAMLRHIVHGRWAELGEMSAHLSEGDDSFCQFVIDQHLTYYVVGRLKADQQESRLPTRWMQRLGEQALRWQDARRMLKQKLAGACEALRKAGVDFRVLKGIPFAQRYYGDIDLRRWADIDLLVREEDVERAVRALWDLGYRDDPPCLRMTASGPAPTRSLLRREHELTLEHERIQIDLHWRFRTAPAYRWDEAEIWARTEDVRVEGVRYPVLPDEYALVLLLVSTAHDIARGGCRLKHLLDVHQLLLCDHVRLDWNVFLEARRLENTLGICVNMLEIVLDLWQEDGLGELRAALEKYAGVRVCGAGPSRTMGLVRSPRGGVENKIWFARVYGVRVGRDATWIVRRTLRHPRRWLLGCGSLVRFGGRWIGGLAGRRGD